MFNEDLKVDSFLTIPAAELGVQVSTSGGPGGQHANKTSTRITLRWNLVESPTLRPWQRDRLREKLAHRLTKLGEIRVQVDERRSQKMNHMLARERLASLLASALVRPKPRRKKRPSRSVNEKRLQRKKLRGAVKKGRQKHRGTD